MKLGNAIYILISWTEEKKRLAHLSGHMVSVHACSLIQENSFECWVRSFSQCIYLKLH